MPLKELRRASNSKAASEVAEAVQKSGGKSIAIQGDMAKEADIIRVFDETTKALGPITHFVHSAGIGAMLVAHSTGTRS